MWGAYLFTGVDGRAVLHNTFLDGNLFHNSHHVNKNIFVGDFRYGAALVLRKWEVSYSYIFRSKEFHRQTDTDSFGSLTCKYKF